MIPIRCSLLVAALALAGPALAQSYLMKPGAETAASGEAAPGAGTKSTAGCHCFRDRTFELERPAAADPYILATTRSSLLSAAFGPGKASLVQAVMTGTAPEDLWIAHFAAARSGGDAGALLEAKGAKGAWKPALAGAKGLDGPFAAALARGAPDRELAGIAVDDVLVRRAGASAEAVRAVRQAGASTEETILATVLSRKLGSPAVPLVQKVRSGQATWGRVLNDAGLVPKQMDGIVREIVR
ncbi:MULTISPECIES: hypothetical protein [Anaeromyxobacter]|uniref:hypothetical protein n=1 Tax=Anaeromyxobacter TaxID=161492 RepID=UPI001F582844|nr:MULTISPECIES: hypothetical protein [unclassified Anaeromyxobacter]